jgi:hypothetical protein
MLHAPVADLAVCPTTQVRGRGAGDAGQGRRGQPARRQHGDAPPLRGQLPKGAGQLARTLTNHSPLTTHHSTSNLQPSTFNLHPTLTLTHPLSLKPHPQDEICKAVEELDGGKFQQDTWTRAGGGGGISRVMTDGNVFEKAGCSLSVVYGSMPQEALASATGRGADRAKGYAEGARSTRKVGPHDVLAK